MTDWQDATSPIDFTEPVQQWLRNLSIDKSGESASKGRPLSAVSLSSEDSVSLEELINANFTGHVDDETDLPDLAELDLDDANEDFWKVDDTFATIRPAFNQRHGSPPHKQISQTPRSERSGSLSSEGSFTSQVSQSTITIKRHQSTANRPASRLCLSSSASTLPRYKTTSAMPRLASSRSTTPVDNRVVGQRCPFPKPPGQRASHIPAPPQRLPRAATSSSLISAAPAIRQRASHIPSIVRSATPSGHRPPSNLLSKNIFPRSKTPAPFEKPLAASTSPKTGSRWTGLRSPGVFGRSSNKVGVGYEGVM